MMKEKIMTPQGMMQFNSALSGYQNAANLLSVSLWEDALASLVLAYPMEKILAWTLEQIIARPDEDDEFTQPYISDITQWLSERDDTIRWRIFHHAGQLGFDTPLGAIGLALFWMQGSMTPAEYEAVYPLPHLAPLMLLCALKLLSCSLAAGDAPQVGAQILLTRFLAPQGGV